MKIEKTPYRIFMEEHQENDGSRGIKKPLEVVSVKMLVTQLGKLVYSPMFPLVTNVLFIL